MYGHIIYKSRTFLRGLWGWRMLMSINEGRKTELSIKPKGWVVALVMGEERKCLFTSGEISHSMHQILSFLHQVRNLYLTSTPES